MLLKSFSFHTFNCLCIKHVKKALLYLQDKVLFFLSFYFLKTDLKNGTDEPICRAGIAKHM